MNLLSSTTSECERMSEILVIIGSRGCEDVACQQRALHLTHSDARGDTVVIKALAALGECELSLLSHLGVASIAAQSEHARLFRALVVSLDQLARRGSPGASSLVAIAIVRIVRMTVRGWR